MALTAFVMLAVAFLIAILFAFQNLPAIPVLEYHHVNPEYKSVITVSPELFEGQLLLLKKMGYEAITLRDFEERLYEKRSVPSRSVVITFDDGFYDNYKFALPILKKHGFKATIFLSTDFIRSAKENPAPRVIEDDFKAAMLKKNYSGFLRWEDIAEMAGSGLIDLEPHTRYHRHRFASERPVSKIIDPLKLNHKDISSFDEEVKRGGMIFEHGPSLTTRAYDPKSGQMETKEAYKKRILQEIGDSKEIIEEKLKKQCRYLAWPWGMFNRETMAAARRLGFSLCLTTFCGSNHFFTPRYKIKRFAPTANLDRFPGQMLRNSYFLSSLCVDDKLYDIFCRRFVRRKLKEAAIDG